MRSSGSSMRYSSNRSGNRRAGVQSFKPGRRNRTKAGKQAIDPARFVKAAQPASQTDYKPQNSFADFEMHPLLKNNVAVKGYTSPSEIQDKTISLGLAGRNIVGVANTGTGKTAAFALPILNKLLHTPGTQALVIAPTRELAEQIEGQCRILAKNSSLSAAVLIGGMPMGRQKRDLSHRPRLIIGTPGRIKDHLNQGTLTLNNCSMVVLDEVDRMLDMGFINDVRFILNKVPSDHQAFFFSATLSPEINSLISTFTTDAVTINVKVGDTSQNVNQDIVRYSGNSEKMTQLHDALIRPEVTKTLVFAKTKHGADRLSKELKLRGFDVDSIHGDKSQGRRKRALDSFRQDQIKILVATDVAARGIDVKDISHVINYDLPQTYDDYIHRIGRAGRAGKAGFALSFVEQG
jgi:ATP-dependent RNA helicase RhlE